MAPQMPKTKQQREKETNSNKKTTTITTHQHKMRTKSFDVKTRKSFSPYRMHLEISRFDNFSCNKRTVYCFRYWFHLGIVESDRVGSGVQCACCSIVLTLVDSFQSQRQTTRLDYLPECVIIFDFSFVFLLLSRSFGVCTEQCTSFWTKMISFSRRNVLKGLCSLWLHVECRIHKRWPMQRIGGKT